ncbi:MAG TPA: YbhB/YbcL family Raf kinase inhibitor-like protein [Blastocatellia bacterium]|nr:YbhB/YbcL family Raf kinase inhibitor-like protein [Blastocatellia bacterium]
MKVQFFKWLVRSAMLAALFPVVACFHAEVAREEGTMKLAVTSSAFKDAEAIPTRYTCDGENTSPALNWSGMPDGTKSLALICDDPDAPAGTWVHWVLYGLPPTVAGLPEGMPATQNTQGALQGTNDFGSIGYGGPCPPSGKPHRYFFKLYALDAQLNLKPGARKGDLVKAMQGHILAEGQLVGTYRRK